MRMANPRIVGIVIATEALMTRLAIGPLDELHPGPRKRAGCGQRGAGGPRRLGGGALAP